MAPPSDLIRVVARPGGGLARGRGLPGRGAWLCAGSEGCVDAAARRRSFARALRTDIDGTAVAALRQGLAGHGRMDEEVRTGS